VLSTISISLVSPASFDSPGSFDTPGSLEEPCVDGASVFPLAENSVSADPTAGLDDPASPLLDIAVAATAALWSALCATFTVVSVATLALGFALGFDATSPQSSSSEPSQSPAAIRLFLRFFAFFLEKHFLHISQ